MGVKEMHTEQVLPPPAGRGSDGEGGWTYEYVPGAGDDEESWGQGLTPSLLYTHQEVRPPLAIAMTGTHTMQLGTNFGKGGNDAMLSARHVLLGDLLKQ